MDFVEGRTLDFYDWHKFTQLKNMRFVIVFYKLSIMHMRMT